jgi:hypothetical protein
MNTDEDDEEDKKNTINNQKLEQSVPLSSVFIIFICVHPCKILILARGSYF